MLRVAAAQRAKLPLGPVGRGPLKDITYLDRWGENWNALEG